MISELDVRGLRIARTELARRAIDVSRADVRVMHGVLHIRGIVGKADGSACTDLHAELEHAIRAMRGKAEIRDVSLEVTYSAR